MIAEYLCGCGYKWETEIQGGSLPLNHDKVHSSHCPNCGSLWFNWTNYKKEKEEKNE